MIKIIEIVIGFSGGLAVGCGFVAFFTMLKIIPRLLQLSKAYSSIKVVISCVITGALFGTFMSFTTIHWSYPIGFLLIWGAIHGIFNGMLAAALTEILNVFPIITRRIGIEGYLLFLLMAFVFGKIAGSLFQWLVLVK